MIKQNIDYLRHHLTNGVEKYLAEGGRITSSVFIGSDCRCPIGTCVEQGAPGNPYHVQLAKQLPFDFTEKDMWSFVNGFDNIGIYEDGDLHSLGEEFRKRYLRK